MPRTTDFFVQGECNCKRCRDKRKLALSSVSLGKVKENLPFVPLNYDPEQGFGTAGFTSIENLDASIEKMLKNNKKRIKKYKEEGVLKSKTRYCADCGKIHKYVRENKVTRSGSPRYLCPSCMKTHYRTCTHCGALKTKTLSTKVRDNWYCRECTKVLFRKCNECGQLHNTADLIEMRQYNITDWDVLCPNCFNDNTTECHDCGVRITRHSGYDPNDTGNLICKNCKEKHLPVHSYNYKPVPIFHYVKDKEKYDDTGYYFGMEIEVELRGTGEQKNRDTMAKRLLRKMGKNKIYMKTDSSLGSPAFEIVTYPQSWLFYKTIKKRWSNMLTWLAREGGSTKSGKCGIHIHINKKSFTTMHTYKFIDFVYKQVNMSFILAVSSRPRYSGNFRSYASLFIDNGCSNAACKRWAKDKGGTGHHSAVDVSGAQQNTYEVRIFNGTLDPDEFHKDVEFVHSLWKYTRDCSYKDANVRAYTQWLMHRNIRNQYVHLVNYLMGQGRIIDDYGLNDIMKGA